MLEFEGALCISGVLAGLMWVVVDVDVSRVFCCSSAYPIFALLKFSMWKKLGV